MNNLLEHLKILIFSVLYIGLIIPKKIIEEYWTRIPTLSTYFIF